MILVILFKEILSPISTVHWEILVSITVSLHASLSRSLLCQELDASINNVLVTFKRDVEKAESVPVLNSRAPVEKQPLKIPASDSDKDFVDFLNGFKTGQQLETRPSKSQVDAWTIPYRGANIPIGATAVYFPFGKTAQTFVMESLIGCTGIIAVVSAANTDRGYLSFS
jgi:hypothetical protein